MSNGVLGEAAVLKELIKQGYTVFTQFSGASPFDMVAYKNNILYRVSVKSTECLDRYKTPAYRVKLSQLHYKTTKHFDNTSCDILAVYIVPEDKVLFFDAKTIYQKHQLNIKKGDIV
jgi:Holliday junction resolvase-like predicted endonuclease